MKTIDLNTIGADGPLLAEAIRALADRSGVTASRLQRWINVGPTKASRLMGLLEAHGLVGPYAHGGMRPILVDAATAQTTAADLRQRVEQARLAARRAEDDKRRQARLEKAADAVTVDLFMPLLNQPRFRRSATAAGYCPGDLTDVRALALDLTEHYFFITTELAAAIPVPGHNLRCNRCGSFGASWTDDAHARPGWGRLALCGDDMLEWCEESRRHNEVLRSFRAGYRVNFEQPEQSLSAARRQWRAARADHG